LTAAVAAAGFGGGEPMFTAGTGFDYYLTTGTGAGVGADTWAWNGVTSNFGRTIDALTGVWVTTGTLGVTIGAFVTITWALI